MTETDVVDVCATCHCSTDGRHRVGVVEHQGVRADLLHIASKAEHKAYYAESDGHGRHRPVVPLPPRLRGPSFGRSPPAHSGVSPGSAGSGESTLLRDMVIGIQTESASTLLRLRRAELHPSSTPPAKTHGSIPLSGTLLRIR